jgi:carbon-monoxide dehydrogenase medium subunit
MKPSGFDYLSPATTRAALEFLDRHGEEARILAGGQSLVPMLNFRLARFKYLIDINSVAELSYITVEHDVLRIGALTRYRTIENSSVVAAAAPLLARATRWVGHPPVRTRGTIGGSLAHADPAAEYPAVLLALDGKIVVRSLKAERVIAAADFIKGVFATALDPDELLTEVRIPVARKNQVFGFEEFARRSGDLAVMGIAACLKLSDGRIEAARVAAFGSEGGARRISEAEAQLQGRAADPEQIERAGRAAFGIPTHSDVHATAALRSHLAGVLTRRALASALASHQSPPT